MWSSSSRQVARMVGRSMYLIEDQGGRRGGVKERRRRVLVRRRRAEGELAVKRLLPRRGE